MKKLMISGILALLPCVTLADDQIQQEQKLVLNCLEAVGVSVRWEQCVALMFKPCAEFEHDTEGHKNCLINERTAWRKTMNEEQAALVEELTLEGGQELLKIIGSWVGHVSHKCQAAARDRDGSASALHGCEVAEIVSATAELVACRERRSTAPYCVMRDNENQ